MELLSDRGITEGLLGPREGERLWDRHILNCAVVGDLIPPGATVIDVGSGAGLPGIPLALARPDLSVYLVEAMVRRVAFLTDCVAELGLTSCTVVTGRVEEGHIRRALPRADVVTARAVGALDRLAEWALPVLKSDGRLLALKGASASEELKRCRPALARYGAKRATVQWCGAGIVEPATTVVELSRG